MKNIMTRAWEIAKEAVIKFGGKAIEYISESLKLAWKEVKEMEFDVKEKLLDLGGNLWENYGKSRIYLDRDLALKLYGLEVRFHNSGNPSSAKLDGNKISNSKAKGLVYMLEKLHFDLIENKFGLAYGSSLSDQEQEKIMNNLINL